MLDYWYMAIIKGELSLEDNNAAVVTVEDNAAQTATGNVLNRRYVSQLERIIYVIKCSVAGMGLGKFDTGTDIFMYQILGIKPIAFAKAQGLLLIYDMINDPLSAAIVDNMRTRWGKFKPFLYFGVAPSTLLGLFNCFLPYIAMTFDYDEGQKLAAYMTIMWLSETIGALFGGGGYIDNVFTPSPNERTELLTISKFMSELYEKFPSLLAGALFDLYDNKIINLNIVTLYTVMKTTTWLIVTIPNIMWVFVSKERVLQSVKPPKMTSGLTAVFKNPPLLIYTLSNAIGGIDIGTSESLYFRNVLKLSSFGAIFGIPGSPISYASYVIAPKLRQRYSTKALWFLARGSVFVSEGQFFLLGALGKKARLYSKVWAMGSSYAFGNCIEMLFYALKKIVNQEISYEVQDYCEWRNGFRVEASMGLFTAYLGKVQGYILKIINAWILEVWTGFETGIDVVQSEKVKYRLFIMAYGPRIIPDILSFIPMLFYNLSGDKRDRMYADLQVPH